MVYVILSILVLLISNVFVILDEEILIIVCSIVWLDAAGGLFKSLLAAELVHKVNVVREKFVWFLSLKRLILNDLLGIYTARTNISATLVDFNLAFTNLIVEQSVLSFLHDLVLHNKFNLYSKVYNLGSAIAYDQLVWRLTTGLYIADFSTSVARSVALDAAEFAAREVDSEAFTLRKAAALSLIRI